MLRNCYGDRYLEELGKAEIVVVPLAVDDISAGQMALIQAMAYGKPVIATRTRTICEYLDDGRTALLVDRKDVGQLRKAICRLGSDALLRERLGRAARAEYEARFSLAASVRTPGRYPAELRPGVRRTRWRGLRNSSLDAHLRPIQWQRKSRKWPSDKRTGMAPEDTERELRLRLRERELLAELGSCALKAEAIEAVLQEASRLVAEGMGTAFWKILEYLPTENQLLVRAGVGWREGVVGHAKLDADTGSPAGYALQSGQPVISNNLSEETRFRTPSLVLEHGIERAINVLISDGDGLRFGVLEADSRRPGAFSQDDIAFLQAAANLLGIAIERHRKQAAFRKALETQGLLIREADHRIKNSLQLVASLLSLQRSRLSDADAPSTRSTTRSRASGPLPRPTGPCTEVPTCGRSPSARCCATSAITRASSTRRWRSSASSKTTSKSMRRGRSRSASR